MFLEQTRAYVKAPVRWRVQRTLALIRGSVRMPLGAVCFSYDPLFLSQNQKGYGDERAQYQQLHEND